MTNGIQIGDEPYEEPCEGCGEMFDPQELVDVYKHGSLEGQFCDSCEVFARM